MSSEKSKIPRPQHLSFLSAEVKKADKFAQQFPQRFAKNYPAKWDFSAVEMLMMAFLTRKPAQ